MSLQTRTPLVAGNWKMNGLLSSLDEVRSLVKILKNKQAANAKIAICPPFTLVGAMAECLRESDVAVGGQDCHPNQSGAHTGDISAEMLADSGARYVIVGHSERRHDHKESDLVVNSKVQAVWRAGLVAIMCVGETETQRDQGKTLDVVAGQLQNSLPDGATAENVVIAYEPVWAIGTGRVPANSDVAEVHAAIRAHLKERFATGGGMRILYGGSVKGSNASELMAIPNVDGALVGGASLKAEDFDAILEAYRP